MTSALDDLPAVVFAGLADGHLFPGRSGDGGDQVGSEEDPDGVLGQADGDDLTGIGPAELDAPIRPLTSRSPKNALTAWTC